jgi:ribosomal protein S17E
MKTPTLHSMVKNFVGEYHGCTTEQIYNSIKGYFPNENPRWLRNAIHSYRARLSKKMKEKE